MARGGYQSDSLSTLPGARFSLPVPSPETRPSPFYACKSPASLLAAGQARQAKSSCVQCLVLTTAGPRSPALRQGHRSGHCLWLHNIPRCGPGQALFVDG